MAHRELTTDNLAAALRALRDCPEHLRGWEWHYLMRLRRVEPLVLKDKTEVNSVAFSPDGEILASADGDGTVKVWNSRTGDVVQMFNTHTDSVVSIAFHPGGKHLAYVGADRQVKVWDLTTGLEVVIGPCNAIRKFGTAHAVVFSHDGRQLAAGSDGVVSVWDWKSRQLLHTFPGHDHHSISVAFSRDGERRAMGSFREGPRLWDPTAGGQPLRSFTGHTLPISALAFSPDGGRLASSSFDRSVKVWDPTSGGLLHNLAHSGNVECVAYSPESRRLASSEDKRRPPGPDPATLSPRQAVSPMTSLPHSPSH